MSTQPHALWRPSGATRKAAAVAVGFWVVAGCVVLDAGAVRGSAAEAVAGAVVVAVPTALFLRMAIRPRIEIRGTDLLVVNPWRTVQVGLDHVLSATPGYRGITVVYESGGRTLSVDAWAVQKANVSTLRNAHTRADDVAEAICAAAASARAESGAA